MTDIFQTVRLVTAGRGIAESDKIGATYKRRVRGVNFLTDILYLPLVLCAGLYRITKIDQFLSFGKVNSSGCPGRSSYFPELNNTGGNGITGERIFHFPAYTKPVSGNRNQF